jgi:hypothetical protein
MTERDWDQVLSVNLKGSFLCDQAVARAMIAADRPGAIVNISSSAIRGDPLGVHYSASKAGVVGLTRAMALAPAPHRIRVNAIAPGLTDTRQPRYGNTEEQLAVRAREIPLGRMAQPAEIASVAVFLATTEACWITGEMIHINGRDLRSLTGMAGLAPAGRLSLLHGLADATRSMAFRLGHGRFGIDPAKPVLQTVAPSIVASRRIDLVGGRRQHIANFVPPE